MEQQQQTQASAELTDLTEYLDKSKIECLNSKQDFPIDNALFDKSDTTFVESDCDPQLVITVGFTSTVKLAHLKFRSPKISERPKVIKIFVNKNGMDFDSCESDNATQDFELKDSDYKDKTELKFVKFQQVKLLTIFIADCNGGDSSILSELSFFGYPCLETNIKNLKKIDDGQ